MDAKDVLLAMHAEERAQARQHESLRATATNMTFIFGALLTSLLFKDGPPLVNGNVLAALLIGVGLFGFLFASKHYERNQFHISIVRQYRRHLEHLVPESKLSMLGDEGRATHNKRFFLLSKLRLHWLWSGISLVFVAIGVVYFFL